MLSGADRTITWTSFNKPSRVIQKRDGALSRNKSTFKYDPNHNRYQQIRTQRGTDERDVKTIAYVGKLYERIDTLGHTEHRNYVRVGGRVVMIHKSSDTNTTLEYLHHDALGSVTAVTNAYGTVIERLAFDAFGKRRPGFWSHDDNDRLLTDIEHVTRRGYTGHEQLDNVKLVHMNARLYDPILGRFISPDTVIQFPASTQGFNRYTYAGNNPMTYVDPSGHFFGAIGAAVAAISSAIGAHAAAAIATSAALVAAGQAFDEPLLTNVGFAVLGTLAGNPLEAAAIGFGAGFTASGGNLKAGLYAAGSAAAFNAIGGSFANGGADELFGDQVAAKYVTKAVVHGAVGGGFSDLMGGSFSDGFVGAGVGGLASGLLSPKYAYGRNVGVGGRVLTAAAIGGTASELSGGKFANGAVTAAFARAFNEEGCHQQCRSENGPSLIERFGDYLVDRFSLNFGGDAGYGTGIAGSLAVDGQTLTDNTIQLKAEGGKVIGANARATFGLDIVKSGAVDGIYTSTRGCAAIGCISGTFDSQGDYSITIEVGPVFGTPSFSATPGYSTRRKVLPQGLDR